VPGCDGRRRLFGIDVASCIRAEGEERDGPARGDDSAGAHRLGLCGLRHEPPVGVEERGLHHDEAATDVQRLAPALDVPSRHGAEEVALGFEPTTSVGAADTRVIPSPVLKGMSSMREVSVPSSTSFAPTPIVVPSIQCWAARL